MIKENCTCGAATFEGCSECLRKHLIFMGGTCNGSLWRDSLIEEFPNVNFFNPENEEAYKLELEMREKCDVCLYVITPKMTGVYSIAEVIDDSNKRPEKTVFCYLITDTEFSDIDIVNNKLIYKTLSFSEGQIKSLNATGKMIRKNGGIWCENLQELKDLLKQYNG
jgi:hypothetical protein